MASCSVLIRAGSRLTLVQSEVEGRWHEPRCIRPSTTHRTSGKVVGWHIGRDAGVFKQRELRYAGL